MAMNCHYCRSDNITRYVRGYTCLECDKKSYFCGCGADITNRISDGRQARTCSRECTTQKANRYRITGEPIKFGF